MRGAVIQFQPSFKRVLKKNYLMCPALAGTIDPVHALPIGVKGLHRMTHAVLYGDMLQRLTNSVRAREATKGDAEELRRKWTDIVSLRVKTALRQLPS